jgi:hypothetical protein
MTITLKNHILIDCLHGSKNDAASVTLWIDEADGLAHLIAHSGSDIPLDGPMAPEDAFSIKAIGKPDYVTTFDRASVENMATELQNALTGWTIGGDNSEIKEDLEMILEDFDLCEFGYEEWLAEYDPDTLADLNA